MSEFAKNNRKQIYIEFQNEPASVIKHLMCLKGVSPQVLEPATDIFVYAHNLVSNRGSHIRFDVVSQRCTPSKR